jgi:hypothetical protein
MADPKSEVVTCPLCAGCGQINKHQAVIRSRDPEFREIILNYQDDVLDGGSASGVDPLEAHQTVNAGRTPTDHILAHRSWKE